MTALRRLLGGYDRRSAGALGLFLVLYGAVLWHWREIFDFESTDWLLVGIWLVMTAVLCWRVDARRDVPRVLVGLAGGLAIEAWGTVTELWTYSTHERPPIWIIPAWPVATLAIDRISRAIDALLPAKVERAAAPLLVLFIAWMAWFARPSWSSPATWLAGAAMVGVVVTGSNRRSDLTLLVGGALLGVFLEYWGTTRRSWMYWTGETPPLVAAVAHGFASVAFQRVLELGERAVRRVTLAAPLTSDSPPR